MPSTQADVLLGGSANVEFDRDSLFTITGLTPVWFYSADNGARTATSAQILQPFGGGGAALSNSVNYNLNHEIIIGPVNNPSGRGRQPTNASIDRLAPAATWSNDEQIGIDGVTVFTVAPTGGLVSGDFSLRYSSSLNRLSLINNFQIGVEAFRINNPTFSTNSLGFTVQGDLLTGDFFPLNGIALDQKVGRFSLNAITAVPEPSSLALMAVSAAGLAWLRRRRAKNRMTSE